MGIGTASPMHFCFASYTYVLIKVAWHSAIVCICVCGISYIAVRWTLTDIYVYSLNLCICTVFHKSDAKIPIIVTVTSCRDNNNDRLTAFDLGQPG